ncbi:hypothetical protein M407DRAFT_153446 [Tulasnella calospora MUT 4182]|uniref:Uncharacterized protein n=1 Tax=Tulasnella calospora MUT 4182 TaxID=1051891 RepID=A0A0C3Q5Q5_9AGAM|nr:hypothetical protein M407DRAFT_153446 [Tulasnella calospora MUT 4182]
MDWELRWVDWPAAGVSRVRRRFDKAWAPAGVIAFGGIGDWLGDWSWGDDGGPWRSRFPQLKQAGR